MGFLDWHFYLKAFENILLSVAFVSVKLGDPDLHITVFFCYSPSLIFFNALSAPYIPKIGVKRESEHSKH